MLDTDSRYMFKCFQECDKIHQELLKSGNAMYFMTVHLNMTSNKLV